MKETKLPKNYLFILLIVVGVFLSSCTLPLLSPPTPTLEPTEIAWQTGTPVPLFAPLTERCWGAENQPVHIPDKQYGINVFLFGTDADRVLSLTNIAGFRWIRQQIHWRDHEGKRNEYVWRPLDQIVNAARAYDMNIMLSIVRSPTWATDGTHDGMPQDTVAFAKFMREVATRYRGRVSAYEVWNEPNLAHESGGKPGDPATYLATLQAAYPAIKSADPCALVLAAPMAATNHADPSVAMDDIPFYEQLYTLEQGAFLDVADAIAVHPGAGVFPPDAKWSPRSPQQSHYYFRHIERIRDIMLRYGDPRHVWITEVGWTVTSAEGAPAPVSEAQQSQYLVDMLWYVRQHYDWIDGVLIWNLNFSLIAPPEDEKTTFSILAPDWSIRPAFLSLQHEIPALRAIDIPPHMSEGATHTFAWAYPGRGATTATPLIQPDGSILLVNAPGTLSTINVTGTLRQQYHASGIVTHAPARSPDGIRYLADSASLLTALQPDGSQKWHVRLRSPVQGSPIFANNIIYTVNRIGEIQAFDRNGMQRWKTDLEMETTPLALSSAGTLFVGKANGEIVHLAPDGTILWITALADELWAELAPMPDGGVVVATVRGHIVALDSMGNIRWQTSVGSPVIASPLVVGDGDTLRIVVAARDGGVTLLAASDGQPRWRFDTESDMYASPTLGPNGILYIGTDDARLLALDAETGDMQWTAYLHGSVRASPVVSSDGNTVYVATTAGLLSMFQRK